MRYQRELRQVKWEKTMRMQIAMHCGPVFAGIKPSNTVTLDLQVSRELVEAFRNSLGSRAESLYRQLTAEQPSVQYLQQNGVQQVTVLFETPWHPEGASVYTFPLEI